MAYTTIDDPSAHFQTTIYTGSGSSGNAITNSGNSNLKPDWLWIKSRSDTEQHTLYDSSRGSTKRLMSDATNAEYVNSTQGIQSFNTDGFTLGENDQNNPSVPKAVNILLGLSSAPELVIVKQRDDAAHDWQTGSDFLTSWAYRLKLNDAVAEASVATSFNCFASTGRGLLDLGPISKGSDAFLYKSVSCPSGCSRI